MLQKTPERQRLKIPEPLSKELLLLSARATAEKRVPVPNKTPERQRLKIPELLSKELLQLSAQAYSEKGAPTPKETPERQRLKIPEPLSKELLQLSAQASIVKGAPVLQKTPERQRHKIPEPLKQKLLKPTCTWLPSSHRKHLYTTGTLCMLGPETLPAEPLKGATIVQLCSELKREIRIANAAHRRKIEDCF
ncbi:hypothetical protein QQF64_031587 [Cirrhinus molitorella]|uniref:Uncharacterized protein n=1 Tax=Cirrhinus molitorella TaxID=172907 RepID=A0ABR3MXC0_9TELE